jgi:hypothetical protein
MSKPSETAREVGQRGSIEKVLDAFLADRAKFLPACAPEKYHTNVHYYVWVGDCEHIKDDERKEMGQGLAHKAQRSADKICDLNDNCPVARLIEYEIKRNVCDGRKWEIDARWTFECIPKS